MEKLNEETKTKAKLRNKQKRFSFTENKKNENIQED
jgi:hypothetical protein